MNRCPQCGAPLPMPHTPFEAYVTCPYCGVQIAAPRIGATAPGVPAPPRKRSNRMGAVVAGVVVFLLLAVFAGTFLARQHEHGDPGWNGRTALSCSGDDVLQYSGISASITKGAVISAYGNCKVTCTGCNLGGSTVLWTEDRATITIVGGSVSGTYAAVAKDQSRVVFGGNAKVSGSKMAKDGATITQ